MEKVGPNVAKLAKQKGFDLYVTYFYGLKTNGEIDDTICSGLDDENWNRSESLVSIPYQPDLQEWLRKVHKIHLYCVPVTHFIDKDFDHYSFAILKGKELWEDDGSYSDYEKCLEAGLQLSLIHI